MPRITNHLAGALLVFLAGCATSQDSSVANVAPPAPPVSPPAPQTTPATVTHAADTVQVPSSVVQPAAARTKVQRGRASWYAHRFHGRRTASGERYNRHALTAAHPTLPIPSYARVRNPANGREVVVRINDRGPFHKRHVIDLSYAAAVMLGIVRGPRVVEIEHLPDVERRGSHWPQERAALPTKPLLTLSARNDKAF
ncbi:septal ring lytic transglycosylase RlpA family protein [uncultured Azohydromonas sp.]|jgi:rare lipoprotein A|uniref:septal ring lytic transglycosylase RlpA family protein n=1 Tax=uncultured Azohydromonas sp. TaxID=487342 RepID=UPI002606384E|nr:septal ring lytic transglycosylase RlpA family protein [uncultured Azohydromonas sp.]